MNPTKLSPGATPPEANTPRIAVVVLNWNGLEDTTACLESLRACPYPAMNVVLVDNGSVDNSVAVLGPAFPEVTLIATGDNLGWAGGNNVGIRHALQQGADQVLLLNNDTVVAPDCIDLLAAASTRAAPGLMHPAIYYFDEPGVAQFDPLEGVVGQARDRICAVNHAYGAALMLHRQVVEKVGLLDERFFLQLEETDYFHRAVAAGFPVWAYPPARVLHKESRSFGGRRTPMKTYYAVRNSLLLASKHARGMAAVLAEVKKVYWALCVVAGDEQAGRKVGPVGFLGWLFSSSKFAHAARAGVLDFLRARFGRASPAREQQLKNPA